MVISLVKNKNKGSKGQLIPSVEVSENKTISWRIEIYRWTSRRQEDSINDSRKFLSTRW